MQALNRFLQYIKIWTSSEWGMDKTPSSLRQFDLAHQLAFELREIGLSDVCVDNHCFTYAVLPATKGLESAPSLGFVAHLDTHPDCPGKNICPQILENYDGTDISLGNSGLTLRLSEYPHLSSLIGQTLITTDGTTLLGADGKAGIAEIMTALEKLISSGKPHTRIYIAFTPDEEIGGGIRCLDFDKFMPDYAYTVDGWDAGEIVSETFNGIQVAVRVKGVTTHTGRGKGLLLNAQLAAIEFANLLPVDEIPSLTEGREGFFHLLHFQGAVESAELIYNLRDFTSEGMKRRISLMKQAAASLNSRYGDNTVQLTFREEYRNMHEKLKDYPQLIANAEAACRIAGLEPKLTIARGGTNGARLSFAGIPCPNLGMGGWAYHGPYEHITAEIMEQVSAFLLELISQFSV